MTELTQEEPLAQALSAREGWAFEVHVPILTLNYYRALEYSPKKKKKKNLK